MSLPTSPTGWLAAYRTPEEIENKKPGRFLPVDAWSSDGDALVVDRRAGQRVPAVSLPHFRGLQEAESSVAGVVPGQGWSVAYVDGAAPDPVVAWMVDRSGYAQPIIANTEGYAEPWEPQHHGGFLAPGHPDASPYRPATEKS